MKGIYAYLDSQNNNQVIYIGKDSHIKENRRHKDHIQKSNYDKQVINRILQNDTKGRYKYERIITGNFTDKELNNLEIKYIDEYQPLHNYTPGGDSLGYGEEHPCYRHDLDDKIIIDMYINQGLSSYDIAKKLNTSDVTIRNRLRNNNIKLRNTLICENHPLYGKTGEEHPLYLSDLDDNIIVDMYVNQGLSCNEIAKKLNTTHGTILRRLRNNNIEIRSNSGENNPSYRNDLDDSIIVDMYVTQKLSSCEIAEKLNANDETIRNRLKNNNIELRSTTKDYPRIVKAGFYKGKQQYGIVYNGKMITKSINKNILEDYLIRLNNGESEEQIKKEHRRLSGRKAYKIPFIRKAGTYKGKQQYKIMLHQKALFQSVNLSKIEQYYFGIIFNMKYDYI